ncbi:MAG TPA: ribosome maturation factor RimM [Actinomycetota bacterium]
MHSVAGGSPTPRLAVGKITKAHGLRGEVSVLVLTEVPERFEPGSTLLLEDGRSLTVSATRPDRGRLLLTFAEVADRTAADLLRGSYLFVPADDAPELPEGSFWPHQLEGCEVVTDAGRPLGVIREVVPGPANDIWVTGPPEAEVLVPALKDVVVSVDVAGRRVVVRDVPGLTSPADS